MDAEDNVGESGAKEAPKDKTPSKLRRRGPEVGDFWWSVSFISWFCIFGEISTAALNRLAFFYFLCFSIWLRQASTTMWLRRVWISIWVKDDSQTKDLSLNSDRDAGWIDPQRLPYAILVASSCGFTLPKGAGWSAMIEGRHWSTWLSLLGGSWVSSHEPSSPWLEWQWPFGTKEQKKRKDWPSRRGWGVDFPQQK